MISGCVGNMSAWVVCNTILETPTEAMLTDTMKAASGTRIGRMFLLSPDHRRRRSPGSIYQTEAGRTSSYTTTASYIPLSIEG